jgi:hypothetical protein
MQRLIADMAAHNHTWGKERIAAELRVKLGLTCRRARVRRYMPSRPRGRGGRSAQSWATFLHNHAGAVLACDFFIVVTACPPQKVMPLPVDWQLPASSWSHGIIATRASNLARPRR